jgi:hypothetical protein
MGLLYRYLFNITDSRDRKGGAEDYILLYHLWQMAVMKLLLQFGKSETGEVHPIICHEGTEVAWGYSCTLSLTSVPVNVGCI